MLIKDLKKYIAEGYQDEIKRQVRDALISLKIQGEDKLSTLQVLKDFSARGIKISIAELINLLQDDPMIQDINREEIVFAKEIPDPVTNDEKKQVADEEKKNTVKKMARRGIGKKYKIKKW